jgi:hypothetical protein
VSVLHVWTSKAEGKHRRPRHHLCCYSEGCKHTAIPQSSSHLLPTPMNSLLCLDHMNNKMQCLTDIFVLHFLTGPASLWLHANEP